MRTDKRTRRAARRLHRLCIVNGALDEARVRHVARRIAAARRRGALSLLAAFQRLVRLDLDRYTARVESATPLAGLEQEALAHRLAARYGPHLITTFRDDPALIGGVRIQVGSQVYDGTVRARLNALAARF
jgi:F-type H+-transporting ATPase subunit delta